MSKTFEFKNVKEVMGRIQPGIDEAVITGVTDDKNDNGKYYLSIKMVSLDGKREHEERFYFSTEKGERISLQRLKSLIREMVGKEKAEDDYTLEQLNAMLTGKEGRWLFVGEEYEWEGDVRLRTSLAFSNFVEKITVKAADSKLKFDEIKNIKKIPKAPPIKTDEPNDEDGGDLF